MFKQTKRIISMVLCLALVFSVFGMIGTQSVYAAFSDTSGHWAESVIDKWSAKGVLRGDGDGTFRPDDSITRAEAVDMFPRTHHVETVCLLERKALV